MIYNYACSVASDISALCAPWTYILPGYSVHEFSSKKKTGVILRFISSGDLPNRAWLCVTISPKIMADGFFTTNTC